MGLISTLFMYGLVAVAWYTLYGLFWRLFLSPIAKFPGHKLAAATFWYEFYYDIVKGGQYVYEIEKMHQQYGPIVRINPYELSINDTDLAFMSKVYPSVGVSVDKFWWSAGMFGNTEMTFGTIPHQLHKLRRAAFSKFFSPAYVRRIEPELKELVNLMIHKITEGIEAGKQVNLVHAFSALTQDVITEYCFSNRRHVLDKENFAPHYYEWMQIQCTFTPVIKQFPNLLPVLNKLPDWWVQMTDQAVWFLRLQEKSYRDDIRAVMQGGDQDKTSHVTIFHEILNDPDLPESEKTEDRMTAEAGSLVGAGTLTSAHMLTLTSFFVLSNPDILENLLAELNTVMPTATSTPDQQVLEGLPYLNAVIDEGLRLSYGSMHRLSRSHPTESLNYKGWVIPPGTPVGYCAYLVHMNADIFEDPHAFKPQRWLNLDANERQRQRSYLLNFGRGSRQCVGMRLAYSELYLTLAYLFRRLGDRLQLYDTEFDRDIAYVQDYFIPAPSKQSQGCRVVAKKA